MISDPVRTKARAAILRTGPGDAAAPSLKAGPLSNPINQMGNRIALVNCHIFDGISPDLRENMTLLVQGEKIFDIHPKEQHAIPEDYFVVDAQGRTVMPGLIDSHVHICSPFTYSVNMPACRQMPKQLTLNNIQTICSGVTTVCDMGGPQGLLKDYSALAQKNIISGPRYQNCFTIIAPQKRKRLGYPTQVKVFNPLLAWLFEGQVATRPKTISALKRTCYKVKNDGGDHLKATFQNQPFSKRKYASQHDFPIFNDDWMKTLFRVGKEIGLVVDIHAPYRKDVEKCVDIAMEVGAQIRIQHMTLDAELRDDTLKKMADYGFYMIPTMMIYGDAFHMPAFILWLNESLGTHMTTEAIRQSIASIEQGIALEPQSGQKVIEHDFNYFREQFDIVQRNTQKAHSVGIIGLGTDAGGTITGFFGRICEEIEHYVRSGIPYGDILKYLTSVNAQVNGLNDRGVLQPGKLADLIIIDGNPLLDPFLLKDVSTVLKGGIFLKYMGEVLTGLP